MYLRHLFHSVQTARAILSFAKGCCTALMGLLATKVRRTACVRCTNHSATLQAWLMWFKPLGPVVQGLTWTFISLAFAALYADRFASQAHLFTSVATILPTRLQFWLGLLEQKVRWSCNTCAEQCLCV